jgi:curved DNA-binding protein CbpA
MMGSSGGDLLSEARMRTPKLVPGRGDLRQALLSPTDGFVLSRVDGVSDELQIALATGLPREQVRASFAKLESLGIVTFDGVRAASPQAPPPLTPRAPSRAPVPSPPPAPAAASAPMAPGDNGVLSEDVELDADTRRLVLETHRALEHADHYRLLGLDPAADKKAVKRAYFELAAKFHPDRYFRKKLGSFKLRIEAIFGRLTLAYEALSNADMRAEYDMYLEEQRRARGIEDRLAEADREARRAEESIEREVRAQSPVAVPSSSVPPAAPATPVPTVDLTARRDALARRLLGGRGALSSSNPPPRSSLTPPPTPSVTDAMDALRRRYEERVKRAKTSQARKYAANGESALSHGDAVAAANAYRIALSLTPDDPELERLAHEAQARADNVLSETYVRQAAYEEKTGQWIEATRSWRRVCKAHPNDPDAYEHAANAIVKAGGDLHEAGRFAERACTLEPKTARYRVALANVYLAAGLVLNARRELETAAQLSPHDGSIQAMMRRIGSKG